MKKLKRQNGFTMIELIIVIILISILSVGGIYILTQVFQASYTTRDLSNANWQGRLALERMTRDVRATRYPSGLSIGSTGQSLTFTDTEEVTARYEAVDKKLMRTEVSPIIYPADTIATGISSIAFYAYDGDGAQQVTADSSTRYIQVEMLITEGNTKLPLQTVIYPFNFAPGTNGNGNN